MRTELTGWLIHYAPSRLVAYGVEEDLLHWIRLLGLNTPARWMDPHWPGDGL